MFFWGDHRWYRQHRPEGRAARVESILLQAADCDQLTTDQLLVLGIHNAHCLVRPLRIDMWSPGCSFRAMPPIDDAMGGSHCNGKIHHCGS